MGKVLYFPGACGAQSAMPATTAWDTVATLLSTISDGQARTAGQLVELLTRLEAAQKSLLKAGAPSPASHVLRMDQARTIEFLIETTREKLCELSSSQSLASS
jgi:hypothetical protein